MVRPPMNTPDSCHRKQFGEFQYLHVREYPNSNSSLSTRDGQALSQSNLSAPPVARGPQSRRLTMKISYLLAALLLVPSLATPTTAQERTHKSVTRAQTYGIEGRQIAAPPWSAACMTDHGPSECGEPMWIYGSRSEIAPYRNAF